MSEPPKLCYIARVLGVAGPAAFQRRFTQALITEGVQVDFDWRAFPYDAALVIGATRDLRALWQIRKRGIPILQRLNGMNWIHRRRRTGLRHALRAELNNGLLRIIRDRFLIDVHQYNKIQGVPITKSELKDHAKMLLDN